MKRMLFIILAAVLILSGCMTANQLAGEKAYYEAMAAMQTTRQAQPIFEMVPAVAGQPITLGNVGSFKVYAQPGGQAQTELRQYQHQDYVGPWLRVVGAALPYIGMWGVVHEVGKATAQTVTNYNQTVGGQGNTAAFRASGNMSLGNVGDGSMVAGQVDTTIADSGNTTTTTETVTTATDDHSTVTDDHSAPTP